LLLLLLLPPPAGAAAAVVEADGCLKFLREPLKELLLLMEVEVQVPGGDAARAAASCDVWRSCDAEMLPLAQQLPWEKQRKDRQLKRSEVAFLHVMYPMQFLSNLISFFMQMINRP